MLILGIESSCDDTAAAILQTDQCLLSSLVSSQDTLHQKFGGVVPELASRKHIETITSICKEALHQAQVSLDDIELIAVTQGPGLIGSLLVGFSYAKALSYASNIPFIGVDHMAGHLLSVFLSEHKPPFPFIALIVSGGTTSLFRCDSYTSFSLLGRTRDDAAGEAFDKIAKLMDLGYPGGPHVYKAAANGDSSKYRFPRSWLEEDSLDFSFSGLKTAVMQCYNSSDRSIPTINDICASFQESVIDVLVGKTLLAAKQHSIPTIVLGGGVSANGALRQRMEDVCVERSLSLYAPELSFCTDNGAMIAFAGYHKFLKSGAGMSYDEDVYSRSPLG